MTPAQFSMDIIPRYSLDIFEYCNTNSKFTMIIRYIQNAITWYISHILTLLPSHG